jgi:hypothetical protein
VKKCGFVVGNARRGIPCGPDAALLEGFRSVATEAGTAAGLYRRDFFKASGVLRKATIPEAPRSATYGWSRLGIPS